MHGCREVYFLLAALCLLVGATTTHGLGGSLRHKQTGPFTMELGSDVDTRQPDPVTTWRFYQPFRYTPAGSEPHHLALCFWTPGAECSLHVPLPMSWVYKTSPAFSTQLIAYDVA